jgi:hypothetical protein
MKGPLGITMDFSLLEKEIFEGDILSWHLST